MRCEFRYGLLTAAIVVLAACGGNDSLSEGSNSDDVPTAQGGEASGKGHGKGPGVTAAAGLAGRLAAGVGPGQDRCRRLVSTRPAQPIASSARGDGSGTSTASSPYSVQWL